MSQPRQISASTAIGYAPEVLFTLIDPSIMTSPVGLDSSLYFIEKTEEPGTYLSSKKIIATIDKTYYLKIEYNSKAYTANAYMESVTPFSPLSYNVADNSDSLYTITWVTSTYNSEEQAMYEILIDWTHLVDTSQTNTETKVKVYFYCFSTIDVSLIFPPDKEEVLFPGGSIIIEKKYSLTPEYAEFLRALITETEWQGSVFEQAPENIPTNISNGGLGFFSACSVITDTIIVN